MRWVKVYRFQQISKLKVRVCSLYKFIVMNKAKVNDKHLSYSHGIGSKCFFSFTLSLAYGYK